MIRGRHEFDGETIRRLGMAMNVKLELPPLAWYTVNGRHYLDTVDLAGWLSALAANVMSDEKQEVLIGLRDVLLGLQWENRG